MEALVGEWRRSGISAAEMAARAHVSEGTLWRWRKQVGPDAGTAIPQISFLPVRIVEGNRVPETGAAARSLDVVLRSGTRISIPEGFSAEALESLLGIVVKAC
jgi:transposase-like protein